MSGGLEESLLSELRRKQELETENTQLRETIALREEGCQKCKAATEAELTRTKAKTAVMREALEEIANPPFGESVYKCMAKAQQALSSTAGQDMLDRMRADKEEIERLRTALKPFVNYLTWLEVKYKDSLSQNLVAFAAINGESCAIYMSDLVAARTALGVEKGED